MRMVCIRGERGVVFPQNVCLKFFWMIPMFCLLKARIYDVHA